jgi:hypothetical protein
MGKNIKNQYGSVKTVDILEIPLNPRQSLMGETPKTALAPLQKGDFEEISSSPLFKGG